VIGSEPSPYSDTPTPKCFGTVSALDPQTFSTIDGHAADQLAGTRSARYSPIEVAQWMEDCANASSAALDEARRKTAARRSAAFRRIEADIEIQIGLGRFFASKLRSSVFYALFEQSEDTQAVRQALDEYNLAREAWATMAARAATIYRSDITYGSTAMRRGHWNDRLAAIDKDIASLTARVRAAAQGALSTPNIRGAMQDATGRPARPAIECIHTPPAIFQPGEPLKLSVSIPQESVEPTMASVSLLYRHVNQAERWKRVEMEEDGDVFSATIPSEYTQSPYSLEYRFELRARSGAAWLDPAFNATLSDQPYYAVMRRGD
jgi:hypothetical protein